jgi:hypothetical protein
MIALFVVAAGNVAAAAGEMRPPRLSHIHPDWNAVAADLDAVEGSATAPSNAGAVESARGAESIARLNRVTTERV